MTSTIEQPDLDRQRSFGRRLTALTSDRPWVWAYLGSVLMWIAICVINGRLSFGVVTAVFALAPFLVLAGIGQMFVITLGGGSIDLTVSNVITLTAFAAAEISAAANGNVALGILAVVVIGVLVGGLNAGVILGLKVPPIVATLAAGLILQSAVNVIAGLGTSTPSPALADFTQSRVLGISVLGAVCVAVAVLAGIFLRRSITGRRMQAFGQNAIAARLSGVSRGRVVLIAYLISGVLAAIAGALLGAFSGPNVALGDPYQLNSIAVVVLGGTLIAGGRSNVAGIWGAGLFLLLLNTLLNSLNVGVAAQDIVKGILIILVLSVMSGRRER